MPYIPVIPPHAEPPSPRTRELSELLVRAIEEYEKYHPSVTGTEVRAALRMAARRSSGVGGADRRAFVVGAGAAVLGVLFFGVSLFSASEGGGAEAVPMVAVSVAVLVLLLLVVVLKRMER